MKGIGPATARKLAKAGVKTIDDLRRMEVEAVSAGTRLSRTSLVTWKVEAQLIRGVEDLKGVGPALAKRLRQAGLKDLDALTRASRQRVAKAAGLAAEKAGELQQAAAKRLKVAAKDAERLRGELAKRGRKTARAVGALASAAPAKAAGTATRKATRMRKDLTRRGRKAANATAKGAKTAYASASKTADEAARRAGDLAAEAGKSARAVAEDAGSKGKRLLSRVRARWNDRK